MWDRRFRLSNFPENLNPTIYLYFQCRNTDENCRIFIQAMHRYSSPGGCMDAGETGAGSLLNSRPRLHSARPYFGSARHGAVVAQRSPDSRSGFNCNPSWRHRTKFLPPSRMDGHAEPRADVDIAHRPGTAIYALAEGFDVAQGEQHIKPHRRAVLAGPILGSLTADCKTDRSDNCLYRKQRGFGWFRAMGVVERRRAGESACPTIKIKVAI
jgi:hypothetical protein